MRYPKSPEIFCGASDLWDKAYSPFLPHRFVSLSCTRVLPTLLFIILSSSIDSPCDLCSACLLPTVHLGNALYSNRSYTLLGGSRQQAKGFAFEHFTILYFLPRTIAYTAKQLHQQASGRSHPHNGFGIRIRSSTLPRTIAYAAEQLH